jgi:hypothetical protein
LPVIGDQTINKSNDTLLEYLKRANRADNVFTYLDPVRDIVYTYQPLDVFNGASDKEAEEAYLEAQNTARQLVREWAMKAYVNDQKGITQTQADWLKKLDEDFKAGRITPENFHREIVRRSQTTSDTMNMINAENKANLDLKTQLDAYRNGRRALTAATHKNFSAQSLVPTVGMAAVTIRLPQTFLDKIKLDGNIGTTISAALKKLLSGSTTFAVAARPWRVTALDRRASKDGHLHERQYKIIEVRGNIWLAGDTGLSAPVIAEKDKLLRFSFGGIFGPVNDLKNLKGSFLALSGDYHLSAPAAQKMLDQAQVAMSGDVTGLKVPDFSPSTWNVKTGFIATNTQVQGLVTYSPFVMFGREWGVIPKSIVPHINIGYLVPFDSVVSFFNGLLGIATDPLSALLGVGGIAQPILPQPGAPGTTPAPVAGAPVTPGPQPVQPVQPVAPVNGGTPVVNRPPPVQQPTPIQGLPAQGGLLDNP